MAAFLFSLFPVVLASVSDQVLPLSEAKEVAIGAGRVSPEMAQFVPTLDHLFPSWAFRLSSISGPVPVVVVFLSSFP